MSWDGSRLYSQLPILVNRLMIVNILIFIRGKTYYYCGSEDNETRNGLHDC
jgi:hypothetical protein